MNIFQVSDFHLFSSKNGTLHGFNTFSCLQAVMDKIINNGTIKAEAIVVTGDISEDRTIESYQLALQQLERLKLPIHYIPGNHDDRNILHDCFATSSCVIHDKIVKVEDWVLVKMDTTLVGSDGGVFTGEDNALLQQVISDNPHAKIALFTHHHPFAVGIPLVDSCMLTNSVLLLRQIENCQQIKGVYCGHAHVSYQTQVNDCSIEVCPATCFQWRSGADTVQTKNSRGYKILRFSDTYSSTVYRLT